MEADLKLAAFHCGDKKVLNSLYRDGMVEALEPELVHNYAARFQCLADIYPEQ